MLKFEVGKVYTMRSISDSECQWKFNVIRRTEKSIWVEEIKYKDLKRIKIYIDSDGNEYCYPLGRYSKCPMLRARNIVEEEKPLTDSDLTILKTLDFIMSNEIQYNCNFCWWDYKGFIPTLVHAASVGWIKRSSHTQVHWTKAGIEAVRKVI